jgi:hypothetical protein
LLHFLQTRSAKQRRRGNRKMKKKEKERGEKNAENKGEYEKCSFIFSTMKIFIEMKIQRKERETNTERKIQT